jgi:hypothetical protein
VTQAEADRLEAYATRRGITKGEAIRDALAMLSVVTGPVGEAPPDWRVAAQDAYERLGGVPATRPTVTPQPFLQTDLVEGQVSLAPSRAERRKESPGQVLSEAIRADVERHLHKYVQVPTTEYFVGGVKQAHFECACGASKSDRVRS